MNASNKNTHGMHHPRRRNVTTSVVGLKTVTYAKISSKMVNPRDLAWDVEEEEFCLEVDGAELVPNSFPVIFTRKKGWAAWTTTTIIIIIIIMMMMMIIIIIIVIVIITIIIIIAFKGAIRDFFQSSHSAANCLQQVRSSGPGTIVCKSRAIHRALITCNMSCYVPLGTKGQLSYYVWHSWNRIYLSFILLAESLNRWRRGGNRSTRRKPLAMSFRRNKREIIQNAVKLVRQNPPTQGQSLAEHTDTGSAAVFLDAWTAHTSELWHDRGMNEDGASKRPFTANDCGRVATTREISKFQSGRVRLSLRHHTTKARRVTTNNEAADIWFSSMSGTDLLWQTASLAKW